MKKILFICALFFFTHSTLWAQTVDSSQLTATPKQPGAYESVMVRLESYSSNLNTLEVTWSLDGKVQKKGIGEKDFQFTTEGLGSVSTVTVSTSEFTKSITLRPAELDIVWQTNTYVPPFYKGKALDGRQSSMEFIALPSLFNTNGTLIDPKTLTYTWYRNGSVLGTLSGYGKQVISNGSGILLKPFTIEVEASTPDGSQKIRKGIEIQNIEPEVVFYENHPLYGIMYNRALPQEFSLLSKEISLVVAPYFFETNQRNNPSLSYDWQMNGVDVEAAEDPSTLILRQPEEVVRGTATLSLSIKHIDRILQFAQESIKINFNI